MRKHGKLVRWDDEKGFGFIAPKNGGTEVFAHISEFQTKHPRPTGHEAVTYLTDRDTEGRTCAVKILYEGESQRILKRQRPGTIGIGIAIAFFGLLVFMTELGRLNFLVPVIYVCMSLLSFINYTLDKSAAQEGRWRIQESKLHIIDLLCGWPGGLIAQSLLRHKTSKGSFRIMNWCVIALNCLFLLAILLPAGNRFLQSTPT